MWRSLVACLNGVQEAGGSNPLTQTTVRPKTQFSDGYFILSIQKNARPRLQIAKKEGLFPQISAIFLDFGHNCPAVAFDEFWNAAAEGDGSSDVVAQRREREFGGDLFLAPAEKVSAVVIVLDGAEGVLAGSLRELLLSNISPNEHHDALFGAL